MKANKRNSNQQQKNPLYRDLPAYLGLALRPSDQGSSVQHFPATFYHQSQTEARIQTRG